MMYIICIFYNISFVSLYVLLLSHPMRVRGLKFSPRSGADGDQGVAPHAGAWIEIACAGNIR